MGAFAEDTFIPQIFLKLKNEFNIKNVIETGTFRGWTTKWLAENFEKVYTIENTLEFLESAKFHCKDHNNIEFIHGDSTIEIKSIIEKVKDEKCIFFLDAHWGECPTGKELTQIKNMVEKPIIVIHDFYVPGKNWKWDDYPDFKYNWESIESYIKNIYNNDYDYFYNEEANGAQVGCIFIIPKKDVKVITSCRGYGFFSEIFNCLNHFHIAESNNQYVKTENYIYGCKFTDFFENPYFNIDKNFKHYKDFNHLEQIETFTNINNHPQWSYFQDLELRKYVNFLIKKYIKINKNIQEKINDIYYQNFKNKKVLGIHIRQTDHHEHGDLINFNLYISKIKEYINIFDMLYVMSDNYNDIKTLENIFPNKIFYVKEIKRSDNKMPVHRQENINDSYKLGEDILIETYLLSMCDTVLLSASNIDNFVICKNLDIKYEYLDIGESNMEVKKTIIIVDGYINTDKKKELMRECILRLKPLGMKILSISHKPIPIEIQELSDYVITDNIDIHITDKNKYDGIKTFHENEDFYIEDFFSAEVYSHTTNVLVGIENAVKFAKNLGYDSFFKVDYDFHLDERDIPKVINLFEIIKNKKAIFFGYDGFIATHVMFSNCDFYLENQLPITNEDDYYENCKKLINHTSCVELYLGSLFAYKNVMNKILFASTQPGYYFTNSLCNIIDSFDLVKITKVMKKDSNEFYDDIICIKYTGKEDEMIKISISTKNEKLISFKEKSINKYKFFIMKILPNIDYKIKTWDNKNERTKIYTINTNNIFDVLHDGHIKFKKDLKIDYTHSINNKNIFIVSAYPSNSKRLEALRETIKSIKFSGFDILVSTNYPIIDEEILSLIDYYIYDKLDVKSLADYGVFNDRYGWYFTTDSFRVETTFDNGYHFDIFRNLFLGCKYAQNYEHFVYIDGDFEMTEDSREELLKIKNDMLNDNKKLFFFKQFKHSSDEDQFNTENHLVTGVFGGSPSFLINNIKLPIDIYEWIKDKYLTTHALEMSMYKGLEHVINEIHFTESNLLNQIQYSKIGQINEHGLRNILYFSDDNENAHIVLINSDINDTDVEILIDDKSVLSTHLGAGWYHLNSLKINDIKDKILKQIIFKNGQIDTIREINLKEKLPVMMKTNRFIKF